MQFAKNMLLIHLFQFDYIHIPGDIQGQNRLINLYIKKIILFRIIPLSCFQRTFL